MDTGNQRRLAARARELADLSDLCSDTLDCLGAARHAGLDPDALTGLVGCAAALGATSTATYTAGAGWTGRHSDERHFLAHVASIEDDLEEHLHAATPLTRQANAALGDARDDLAGARDDLNDARRQLADASAMLTCRPCGGCHDARSAAITAAKAAITEAQDAIREYQERISLCQETIRVSDTLVERLRWALARLRAVPADLGETYESVYTLIRRGGAMPCDGRWIAGSGS